MPSLLHNLVDITGSQPIENLLFDYRKAENTEDLSDHYDRYGPVSLIEGIDVTITHWRHRCRHKVECIDIDLLFVDKDVVHYLLLGHPLIFQRANIYPCTSKDVDHDGEGQACLDVVDKIVDSDDLGLKEGVEKDLDEV